jgi:hypothetical protein
MAAGRGQLVGAEEAAAERAREDASRANEMALAAAARDLAAGHVAVSRLDYERVVGGRDHGGGCADGGGGHGGDGGDGRDGGDGGSGDLAGGVGAGTGGGHAGGGGGGEGGEGGGDGAGPGDASGARSGGAGVAAGGAGGSGGGGDGGKRKGRKGGGGAGGGRRRHEGGIPGGCVRHGLSGLAHALSPSTSSMATAQHAIVQHELYICRGLGHYHGHGGY